MRPSVDTAQAGCGVSLLILLLFHGLGAQGEPPDCDAGYYVAKDQCRGCPQGTYKSNVGRGPCLFCPKDQKGRNASTHGEGATNITMCYFRPFLISLEPLYGPRAGGTRLNMTFGYLENRIFQRARFGDVITKNCTRDGSSFICYTPAVVEPMAVVVKMELTDNSGEYVLRGPTKFTFRPDPVIIAVDDPNTFLSGGKILRISGGNLDSVAAPIMFVTRVDQNGQQQFNSDCNLLNSTLMTCPTPSLTEVVPPQTTNATNRQTVEAAGRSRRDAEGPKPINNDQLQFFLGFGLDGVRGFGNVTSIKVYEDPVFHRFVEPNHIRLYFRSQDRLLRLKGARLDYSTSSDDFAAVVGDGVCHVTDLATNQMTCLPPLSRPGFLDDLRGPDNSLPVVVQVGYLTFHVGFLKYVDEENAQRELILGLSLTVILMVWLVTVLGCCAWWLRRYTGKSVILGAEGAGPGKNASDGSSSSSGAGEYLYTGDNSDDTAVTGVLPLDVEGVHIAHSDLWAAIDEPLRSKVKRYQIESSRLKLGECIGVGSFGRVYKGELEQTTGDKVAAAVKTLRDGVTSAAELPQFLEEALVMAGFEHRHILPLHGVVVTDCIPYVISEYMDKGDLRAFVKQTSKDQMGPCDLLHYARQVVFGMVYLSAKGFIHRDLAARNCLVNSSHIVKIGDFGLSRDLHGADYYKVGDIGRPLPVKWMSIESLNLGKFSTRSDVWSFGVVMWELLTRGRTPYDGVPNIDLKSYINLNNRLPKPEEASDEMYALMERCWRAEPDDRPSFEELVTVFEELCNNNITITDSNPPDKTEILNELQ